MDFERARYNMVEQQIRTWEVLDPDVLETLFAVRREDFVPPAYRALAFSDLEIPLTLDGVATGENMLAPKVEARMLQSVLPERGHAVLEIGAGSGHMAALLAQFARSVVTCDLREDLCEFARANLKSAGIGNVHVERGHGLAVAEKGSFDVIVLSGSVQFVPESLLQRLNPGGRLIGIVGELPVMSAQRITRTGEREFFSENLFETVAAPLREFPQRERFRF
ncbi:MAG TPA: protein-L-isoaspartate O-methyltransferase [Zeimonas sp.]|nr:protein-L-isoaspartate O-methyltransferase [Zeimonas sp.]